MYNVDNYNRIYHSKVPKMVIFVVVGFHTYNFKIMTN